MLQHYYGISVRQDHTGYQRIRCPLHADSSPSASVNVTAGRWACFVCRLSEDAYAVIQRERGCSFAEAKEFAHSAFGGSSQDLPPSLPGESSGSLRKGTRTRQPGRSIRPRIRSRFGNTWS
ncbi:hypothetical protein H7H31_21425 [Streptomyces buecherae]|nr:hypothetical protein H7H31_21425 [Streptomyces buecherae]